ncbi:17280_t:CDS:2 [Gigaspora margarita]|uniref:17280_t:CDS:1 n=1 Tax=Gigaspora margarita TaxID=4874 RepID=A0ABM8W3S7_GIGMA|nr:17280_t:CDS:2 [Gigaspora margarita]
MRIGGDVPGFLPCKTCSYNWTSDANQRWILFAARERGANIFEAFPLGIPPYWMTNSGCSSGGRNYSDNLNSNYHDAYADYLTEVVKWYKEQGLTFRTLEPFNEPTERFWTYYEYLLKYLLQVGEYLNEKGLSNETSISTFDEYTIDEEIYTESCIDNDAKSYIGQYNTHAYGGTQRMQLFNISKQDNKRLWMSEVGFYSSKDMSTSIKLSEAILNDMSYLKPVAWIYWQVIEHAPNGDDGNEFALIGADFSNSTTSLDIRLSFYGFAQYTKFIRPVCTNKNNISDIWNINVSMFNISSFTAFRTSNNNETLNLLPNIWNITGGILTYLSPANSITTWVFSMAITNFTQ